MIAVGRATGHRSTGALVRTVVYHGGVWVLGFVSVMMDMSSELVHALLPLFLVGTLGASVAVVGLIEGVAESIAMFAKVVSLSPRSPATCASRCGLPSSRRRCASR